MKKFTKNNLNDPSIKHGIREKTSEENIGNLTLADILDIGDIQLLMSNFYEIAHIPMSITDNNGKVLVGVGWQDICMEFHRVHPETSKKCIESDTKLTMGISKGEFRLYNCKNNMWDIATPLIIGNKHLGNIFSGQFFFEDEEIDYEFFRKQAQKYGFNEEEYIKALDAVPRLSRETVDKGMAFFTKLADIISRMSYNNVRLNESLNKTEKLMSSLQKSEEKYRVLANNLEEQVKNRTNELENAYIELEEREKRFSSLVSASSELLYYVSPDWSEMRQLSNRGFIAKMENPSRTWLQDYIPQKDQPGVIAVIKEAIRTKSVYEMEHRFKLADGGVGWVFSRAIPVIDEKGEIIEWFGSASDITERKKAENDLKKALSDIKRSNDELQQFAYVVSHDLQEPLRTIASFTQLLERRYKGKLDSDADEFIEYIVDAAKRMKQQIKDLLEYSRVTMSVNEFEQVDMNSILDETINNLKSAIDKNNAEVIHEILPTVMGDNDQLRRVFQNLIGNAIKYRKLDESPKIYVSCQIDKEKKDYIFSVSDNGIGIGKEYVDRIFMVFQRLHTREEYKGTGVGLSVVKKVIERHGGSVWVESEQGKGSTFYFTIPLKINVNK